MEGETAGCGVMLGGNKWGDCKRHPAPIPEAPLDGPRDALGSLSRSWRPRKDKNMRLIADFIFLVLFLIFLAGWFIAWAAFHVTAGGVHILLALAVVWLIIHFARRRRAV